MKSATTQSPPAAPPRSDRGPGAFFRVFRDAVRGWSADRAPRMGAAISYYTIFSIAPLLLIAIGLAGLVLDPVVARTQVIHQISTLVGHEGGVAVQGLIERAGREKGTGLIATIVGLAGLLFGASGVFVELRYSLNSIWGLKGTEMIGIRNFIRYRLISFAMVLGIGFLLLVSLFVSAILAAVGAWFSRVLPGGEPLWQIGNFLIAFAVTTGLFAMIFKILPEVRISWGDVWIGATVTSALFSIGKFAIGLYLGRSSLASVYGAAGSLAILLVWVYYSAQIVLLGAEFTRAYAYRLGSLCRAK